MDAVLATANSETFGYSFRDSLASAIGLHGTLGFGYDGVGNRITHTKNPGTGVVAVSSTYSATTNKLHSVTLGTGGGRSFTHDAIGSVMKEARTDRARCDTNDNAGRVATLSIGGVLQAGYKYDFAGRQVVRALTSPTPVMFRWIFESDGNRIAEYNEATGALIRE